MYSLIFKKAKNVEKLKNVVFLFRSKTGLPILRKIIIIFFLSNFLFGDCSLLYKEGFCK